MLIGLDLDGAEVAGSLVSLLVSNELAGPVSVKSLLYPLVMQLLLLVECDDNLDSDDAELLLQLSSGQFSPLAMFVEAELGMASWFPWTFVELLSHSLNFVILAMSDTIFVCFISSVLVEFDISFLLLSISLFQRSNCFWNLWSCLFIDSSRLSILIFISLFSVSSWLFFFDISSFWLNNMFA